MSDNYPGTERRKNSLEERVRNLEEETRSSKEHRTRLEKSLESVHKRLSLGFKDLKDELVKKETACSDCSKQVVVLKTDVRWMKACFTWGSPLLIGFLSYLGIHIVRHK